MFLSVTLQQLAIAVAMPWRYCCCCCWYY